MCESAVVEEEEARLESEKVSPHPSAADPSLHSTHTHTQKKLFYDAQMNASHFLFTFDLPLSPKMTEQKEKRGVKKERR